MSIYKGTTLLAGVATNTKYNANNLLDWKWTDHELTDQSWLKADTFSWQDGTVYSDAYNHLVADNGGGTSQTETVGSYTITYTLATDGHKITTDETTVANIYAESGVAWYYVIDTANTRFKLPRENPAREELIQTIRVKGNGMALGLTDGTYNAGLLFNSVGTLQPYQGNYGGEIGIVNSGGYINTVKSGGITTDSTKSGIISDMTDSTSVYKGKKYLYFYVGQFSQSATEQTAGLNAELFNGKVDLDAQNLSTQGKSLVSGLGMPSGNYDELTFGASGATYAAPANGWFCAVRTSTATSNNYLRIINTTSGLSLSFVSDSTNGGVKNVFVPAIKDDVIQIEYGSSSSATNLRFVYAEGEDVQSS